MIRPTMAWAVARAEMRSTRRLARYWVFSVLSVLFGFLGYIYYGVIHAFFSHMTASIGPVGPRFLISAIGIYVLLLFLIGLVFLGFDVRARDEREHMAEVLDSRPITNLEFVLGRGAGLALMAFLPLVFLGILLQTFGSLAAALGWPVGQPVEPFSMMALFVESIAAFLMWSSVIVLLAVVLGNRLLVALVALAIIGLQFWGFVQAPIYLQPVITFIGSFLPSSDILPGYGTLESLWQRLGLVVLSVGIFGLAAALHPRRDGLERAGFTLGGVGVAAAAALLMGVYGYVQNFMDQRARWADAHHARSADPYVDVQHVAGSVAIDPGDDLRLDLELRVRAPDEVSLDTLLFTLNPGLVVERITADGSAAQFTHRDGLVEIDRALAAGQTATVGFIVSGTPNTSFGYLDSAVDFFADTALNANVMLLGVEVSVFDSRYVALMPGAHWLPKAGAAVPTGDPRTHPPDYFTLDLEVAVPADWQVAGPGRSEGLGKGLHRFKRDAPLPAVGLFASNFVTRRMEVGGIEFALYAHPSHRANLEYFADLGDELRLAIEDELADAERVGLEYPYGALSLVEVPSMLRGYDGGWRMDTTQALPGLLLMKETSFPTARFDTVDTEEFEAEGLTVEEGQVAVIRRFFANDVSGGNIFLGWVRNLLAFQTSARGEGALALNAVVDELTFRALRQQNAFFSPHLFSQAAMQSVIGETVATMITGGSDSVGESVMNVVTQRPSVWDRALGTPLAKLDPYDNPEQALNVLTLKGNAVGFALSLGIGPSKTSELLQMLLLRHRGGHYTAEDLQVAAREIGVDLDSVIGDWLHDSALPGFLTSPVEMVRLRDDENGNPQYQTTLHVHNGESAPGLFMFTFKAANPDGGKGGLPPRFDRVGLFRLRGKESMEIGLVTDQPIVDLAMHPFLSLNRTEVKLAVPRVDTEQTVEQPPFSGSRPSAWLPDQTEDIYVDDLDEGFSVTGVKPVDTRGNFFLPGVDLDQGLPEITLMFGMPDTWGRRQNETSWGRYRHTMAAVSAGDGSEQARFLATLPRPGRWRLSYHLPNMTGGGFEARNSGNLQAQAQFGARLGTYDLSLTAGDEQREIEFDAAAAETGWNTLGDFDLPAGEVEVLVSNSTSGSAVVADAIRWSPVGG